MLGKSPVGAAGVSSWDYRQGRLSPCRRPQCIGRVIRHRGDYAAILLVDVRYAQGEQLRIQQSVPAATDATAPGTTPRTSAAMDASGRPAGPLAKLPSWIQQSLHAAGSFGDAFGRLVRFYKARTAEEAAAGT